MDEVVYLDNAATSHPKPESVYRAVDDFQRRIGASPGRSTHQLGVSAGRVVLEARERLARMFNVKDPSRVVLTPNCTESLNVAIKGLLGNDGAHVVTSSVEHNSVMRPLRTLEAAGVIDLTVVQCSRQGWLDPGDVEKALTARTKLIVVTHASNVVGTIQPVGDIGLLARKRGITFLVDAAQSAGTVPIDMPAMSIDLLACSGHKGLLGPQGTGVLVIGEEIDLTPLKEGGTGSRSQHETQPTHLPDRFESGTLNGPGIAGLAAGAAYVEELGVHAVKERLSTLTALLLVELQRTPKTTIYGPQNPEEQTSVVSFVLEGMDTAQVAEILDQRYRIMLRAGLHCSPGAHRTIGSFRRTRGTLRASAGLFSTPDDVGYLGQCLREIVARQG